MKLKNTPSWILPNMTAAFLSAGNRAALPTRAQSIVIIVASTEDTPAQYSVNAIKPEIDTTINSLHSDEFRLKQPMPIQLSWEYDCEYIASFRLASISMSGDSATEAIGLLRDHLVAIFKKYKSAERLGAGATKQLDELEKYIVEKGRESNSP